MKKYILLIFLTVCSLGVAHFLPPKYTLPVILALFEIPLQIFRDQDLHKSKVELQKQQQLFNIGATSHMANVAFDKHAEFCEKYMREVHQTVITMYREGPTKETLNHANKLYELRQDYSAWLMEDINKNLFPFEQALRELGASQDFINSTAGLPQYQKERSKHIDKASEYFKKLLTLEKGKDPDPEIAVEAVKKKIREMLDIEGVVQLRKRLVTEAQKTLEQI